MIDILISTYNGELFLREQLNSILNQTCPDWKIIIRDDGSSDSTVSIIEEYCKNYPLKFELVNDCKNLGCILSFEILLQLSKSQYIMLCDQDDIWMPNKIALTLKKMQLVEKSHPDSPILIHTDLEVVNSNKKVIHSSFWKLSYINPDLLKKFNFLGVYNGITGCSIMLNKTALKYVLPFSANARMHDAWISLCVSKNGYVDYVNERTILYRQHECNQIGVEKQLNSQYYKHKFQNIKKVIEENRLQLKMLNDIEYGNISKYLFFKVLYLIRSRI